MKRPHWRQFGYAGLLAGALCAGLFASWTPLGTRFDNYAYDWMFQAYRPPAWTPETIVLAADEASLTAFGGMRDLRKALAAALEKVAAARPAVVAIDVILSDDGGRESDDALEKALAATPKLALACDLTTTGAWEDPLPRFRKHAAAVGHVQAHLQDEGVLRAAPLAVVSGRDRRWALALEAFRLSRGGEIVESPDDLEAGTTRIPAMASTRRLVRVRYTPPNMDPIPAITLKQLAEKPELAARFHKKVVFVGLTAQNAIRDRWLTPYSQGTPMPGVEIHANLYETLAQGLFLTDAPLWSVAGLSLLVVAALGAAFYFLPAWAAYTSAAAILIGAHAVPFGLFRARIVFPYTPLIASAWSAAVAAGAYQFFVVRRRLRRADEERERYQQTMHFVTHEMKTPLTAIQGSSELITRYANMNEEKRKQIAELIHSESRRLSRMIETFLNVERLSAGQMELKRETFEAAELARSCVERAQPLAARKQIRLTVGDLPEGRISGDRELMEYAFYNLVNNAIKYSPPETETTISGARDGGRVRLSVRDQGIGMDAHEVSKIFQRFYRTKRAEQSGETGTGIGLSIVKQIVEHHGGTIEVTSQPGKGSCFTLIAPAAEAGVARQ